MLSETCKTLMQQSEVLDAVEQYIIAVFADGDWANDFLTHLPECGRPLIEIAGHALAIAIGF